MSKKIILLASGNGSNVENICHFFEQNLEVQILEVYTNNPDAAVLERIKPFGLKGYIFNKTMFTNGDILKKIKKQQPDLVVLAGFLWKIGIDWIDAFPLKIINIHPALLPKYGGKGMYGSHVHKAVKKNNEKETGITIHYVSEAYDKGVFISQNKVALTTTDTIYEIEAKVHALEQEYFPKVINSLLKSI